MKQMEIDENDIENEAESLEEQNIQKEKKKISIVENDDHLPTKRSPQVEIKHRPSHSSDRTVYSKTYSYKCGLDDQLITTVMNIPSIDSFGSSFICSSTNLGVKSMSFDFPKSEMLSTVEAAVFGNILLEASDRLDLLKRTIDKERKSVSKIPKRELARKKDTCDEANERMLMFPEDAGYIPVIVGVDQKLLKDWNLVYNVFRKITCELQTSNSYDWLRSEVNTIIDSKEKECNLEANLKIWIDLSKRLQDLLKMHEKIFENEKQEYMEKTEKLAADIDSSYCINTEKLDYARRWEASRLEQQNLEQNSQEKSVLNEINELEKAKSIDTKVSQELITYLKFVINNKEAEVLAWTLKYNDELEQREQEIKDLKEKMDHLQEFLEESRILQSQRQVVIDKYLDEQRKIQEEKDYWNDVTQAATLVQAIWRGYMVRQKLGPYSQLMKKTKKKKKSKKSAKKSKKK